MRYTKFTPRSKFWDTSMYYRIFEENNIKYFSIIAETDREPGELHDGLGWFINFYQYDNKIELDKLFDFGIYYQLEKYQKKYLSTIKEYEPEEVLFYVNNHLIRKISPEGYEHKYLVKIDENTPCGYYFGG